MSNTKSVLIPVPLVKQIIELLDYWDISKYDRAIRDDRRDVLRELNVKLHKLELRDAYSKMVNADNEDRRHDARMEYLCLKNRLNDLINDGCIF
jgi:hypothetical protein